MNLRSGTEKITSYYRKPRTRKPAAILDDQSSATGSTQHGATEPPLAECYSTTSESDISVSIMADIDSVNGDLLDNDHESEDSESITEDLEPPKSVDPKLCALLLRINDNVVDV